MQQLYEKEIVKLYEKELTQGTPPGTAVSSEQFPVHNLPYTM